MQSKTGKYKERRREKVNKIVNLLLSEDLSRNTPWPFFKVISFVFRHVSLI